MASIVGEWRNATSDVQALDDLISAKTKQLNAVTAALSEANAKIELCHDKASPNGIFKPGCLAISGRHISSWRDIRDTNITLNAQYTADLKSLTERRAALVSQEAQSAATNLTIAEANTALAKAEDTQTSTTAKKYGLYIGIGIGAIALMIGAVILYKKLKKRK